MEELEYRAKVDTAGLWRQIGSLHAALVNDGYSVGFSVYIKQLAHSLSIGLIKITLEPKVSTDGASDDACIGEFRLSGDLEAFRSAVKASCVDG